MGDEFDEELKRAIEFKRNNPMQMSNLDNDDAQSEIELDKIWR